MILLDYFPKREGSVTNYYEISLQMLILVKGNHYRPVILFAPLTGYKQFQHSMAFELLNPE